MSSAVVPVAVTAIAEQPTPEGERALRDALSYIARADAAATRRAYAADWRHSGVGAGRTFCGREAPGIP